MAKDNAPGRWMEDVPPEPVTWVNGLEDRIPRGILTLVAAPRRMGKSTATVFFASETARNGGRVRLNSKEDSEGKVIRPRLDVAGVTEREAVRISNLPYNFPADLDAFIEDVAAHRYDLVVVDSLQSHVHGYQKTDVLQDVLERLKVMAEGLNVGVLVVAHFIKSNSNSVVTAIGGPGTLQDQCKGICILGPQPKSDEQRLTDLLADDDAPKPPQLVLAWESLGIAVKPDSMAFTRQLVFHPETNRSEPFLQLEGVSTATAVQVLEAIKKGERPTTDDDSRVLQLAVTMINILIENGGEMKTTEFNGAVEANGFSMKGGTYDRARRFAQVQSFRRSDSWLVRNGWTGAPLPGVSTKSTESTNSTEGSTVVELTDDEKKWEGQ